MKVDHIENVKQKKQQYIKSIEVVQSPFRGNSVKETVVVENWMYDMNHFIRLLLITCYMEHQGV